MRKRSEEEEERRRGLSSILRRYNENREAIFPVN